MGHKVIASARVRLTVDIPLTDRWGNDCSVEQIQKQARDSVEGMLRNNKHFELQRSQIVDLKVTAVMVEEER